VDLQVLQRAVVEFAHERDWERFHDLKNLSMALASEVGELNAVFRWVRNDDIDQAMTHQSTRDAVRHEIGDVAILLLLLCARSGIALDQAVTEKLGINAVKYPAHTSRGLPEPPSPQSEPS